MTDANPSVPRPVGSEEPEPTGPKVTDKRRLDPETGALRQPGFGSGADSGSGSGAGGDSGSGSGAGAGGDSGSASGSGQERVAGQETSSGGTAKVAADNAAKVAADNAARVAASYLSDAKGAAVGDISDPATDSVPNPVTDAAADAVEGGDVHPDTTLAADLTRDLQRLQAEYVNYKKRVDRDRQLSRDVAVSGVIEAMLPVLDDIHLARQHGDLEGGPFAAIADKLDGTLAKFGVVRFGQPGDAFDPNVHEALMHIEAELAEGTEATTVVQVLQPGYRMGERVIRAARVAVADPLPKSPQT